MARHRKCGIEIKRQVAQEFLDGESFAGLARRHDVDRSLVRKRACIGHCRPGGTTVARGCRLMGRRTPRRGRQLERFRHACALKGWFDRVFVNGGLYTSAMRYDRGYLRGRKAVCSVTTGAPEIAFGPCSRGGDIDRILWSTHYSLHYMGFQVLPPFVAFGIQGHGFSYTEEDSNGRLLGLYREKWKERLNTLDQCTPLAFQSWDDWDEDGRAKSA